LVLIRGESGVGKTRLALEVTRLAAQRGLLVLTGQCVGLGVGEAAEPGPSTAPLHPLRPLLLTVADLARAGGEAEAQRLLGARGAVLAAYEPALGGLPGLGEPTAPPELPPDAARARVIDSVRQTLFALAASTPLVLLLDDLQWMDELSLSVLETLAEEPLARPPVLVVGTYRSEETPPVLETLARAPGVTVIPLGRLDGASVGSMVSGMLALRAPPVGVLDVLVRQSDGNPFFVAEYLRAAISEGMLTRDPRGRWHFDERGTAPDSLAALPLPRTLAELIDRRLSRLDGTGHALVAWGSVLGREFDAELLLADTGHSEGALLGAMEALRVRNILEEAGAGRLRFGHDKLRETAYERIPVARRRALHQRAGELLEARHGEAADLLPVLAHHFARGEVHDKASHYFVQAARRARAAYANGEAIAFYGSALTEGQALLASGDDPGRHDALGALQEELGDVLALAGRQAEARAAYQQALTRASGASLGRARLLRKEGKTWETHHQHDEALASYAAAERALEASQEGRAEGWWHEWLQLQVDRVSVHYFAARQEEMEDLVRRVQPVVEQRGAPVQRASFFQALVQKNLRAERYRTSSETVEHARASLRAREEVGEPGAVASARFALGAVLLWHDAFGEALDVLTEALRAVERRGDLPIQARCLTYLAMLHRRRRKLEPTRQWSNQGLEVATAARMADYAGAAQANLAWVALRRGDLGHAERQGLAALDAWKPLPLVYPFQWTALLPLACIEQRRGRHAEAVARLHAALDPKQQRLPDALGACFARCVKTLEHGPTAHLGDLLQRALTEAEREGFL
ncbi:ATP-binding protein, partial [Corallococcus llansteffanensis]|uniref:ATP-binding protein n=1 Tax=Corallococcus llansteffanensis TaxID=2316731 RepID=UPI0011C35B6D